MQAADRLHVVQRLRAMSASASRHVASGQDRRKDQAGPGAWPPGRNDAEAGRQAPGTGLRGRRLPAGALPGARLHAPDSWKGSVERAGLSALRGNCPGLAAGGIFSPSGDDLPDLAGTALPRLVNQLAAVRTPAGWAGRPAPGPDNPRNTQPCVHRPRPWPRVPGVNGHTPAGGSRPRSRGWPPNVCRASCGGLRG